MTGGVVSGLVPSPHYRRFVPGFWFTVADVLPADDGSADGVFLIGPPGETAGGLHCGDLVVVPIQDGEHITSCLGFPLLNLGPDRLGWVSLHVAVPEGVEVRVGARVTRVGSDR